MIVQARTFTNSILRHHHHAWRALPGENQSRQLDFQTQSSKINADPLILTPQHYVERGKAYPPLD